MRKGKNLRTRGCIHTFYVQITNRTQSTSFSTSSSSTFFFSFFFVDICEINRRNRNSPMAIIRIDDDPRVRLLRIFFSFSFFFFIILLVFNKLYFNNKLAMWTTIRFSVHTWYVTAFTLNTSCLVYLKELLTFI